MPLNPNSLQGMSVYFDREHQEIAMELISCETPASMPLWYLVTFSMVAFFSCILFVIAVSIGIYEWRAGRCCCCRRTVALASQASTGPASSEFATVQATLTPGIDGGYGATGKIEQAKPIFDEDDDDGETVEFA